MRKKRSVGGVETSNFASKILFENYQKKYTISSAMKTLEAQSSGLKLLNKTYILEDTFPDRPISTLLTTNDKSFYRAFTSH